MRGRNAILLVVFLDLLGAGLVVPLLPYIAQSFGATPFLIGIFASLFPAMQTVSAPLWGFLSDRIGRRRTILLSIAGNVLACLLFVECAHESSLVLFLFSRILAGTMSGSIVTAKAFLADLSTPDDLSSNMGLYGAAQALGFLVGPAIGGLSSTGGFLVPALIALSISMMTLATSFLMLPVVAQSKPTLASSPLRSILQIFTHDSQLKILCLQLFVVAFALSHIFITFPLYIQETFGFTGRENGLFFVLLAFIAIVVQGFVYGKLVKKWRDQRLLQVGIVLLFVGLVVFPLLNNISALFALVICTSIGFSIANPALLSLIAARATPEFQGRVSGVSEAFSAAARTLGPISAGLLIHFGGTYLSFAVAGALSLLCLLIFRT